MIVRVHPETPDENYFLDRHWLIPGKLRGSGMAASTEARSMTYIPLMSMLKLVV